MLILLGMVLFRGERWFRQATGLPYGDDLLFQAICDSDVPGMRHALRRASPNASTSSCTALMWAASTGNEASVRCLLNAGARIDDMGDLGRTALVDAALTGNVRMVKLLLDHGANPNEYTARLGTPLRSAVLVDNEAVVRLLLSRGADPNLAMEDGSTPLDIAESNPSPSESIRACLVAAGARRSRQAA